MDSYFMCICLFLCTYIPLNQGNTCFSNSENPNLLNTYWFGGYNGQFRAPQGLRVRQFTGTQVKLAMHQSMESPISLGTCQSGIQTDEPLTYRIVKDAGGDKCVQVYEGSENVMLYQEVDAGNANSVSGCPDEIYKDNVAGDGLSQISVPYINDQFDFSGANCGGLPRRSYHATVTYNTTAGEWRCNSTSSKVVISDTDFTMDTCATGNTYDSPFSRSVILKCVAQLSPTVLGNKQNQGVLYILGYENIYDSSYAGTFSFHCFFTKTFEDNDPRIEMSFDSERERDPACRHVTDESALGYRQVGSNFQGYGNYKNIVLRPNDCPDYCMNGGTCTQYLTYATCGCVPGWTDPRCSTNIDDCDPNPCLNGGTCHDRLNAYTCACTKYWRGDHCEIPVCLIPEEMAGQWNAGVEQATTVTPDGYRFEATVDKDKLTYWMDETNIRFTYSAKCDAAGFGEWWNYLYLNYSKYDDTTEDTTFSPVERCMKFYIPEYKISAPLMWYRQTDSVELSGSGRPEQECRSKTYMNKVFVMSRVGDSTTTTCPMTAGGYHIWYQKSENPTEHCKNESDTKITVGGSKITIEKSCGSETDDNQENFAQVSSTSWDCVADYSSNDVFGKKDGEGRVLIVRNTANTVLACLRYNEPANGRTVEMSMYFTNKTDNLEGIPYQAICMGDYNYNSKGGENYLYINLESDQCRREEPDNPANAFCMNGGTCTSIMQNYYCTCLPGYTGKKCEINIDDCVNHRCLNGGSCIDGLMSYTCDCVDRYTGTYCELYDECFTNPCIHGNCTDNNMEVMNTLRCTCDTGYRGSRCEIDINECASGPCQNGGTCYDSLTNATSIPQVPLAQFECVCPPGFEGIFCETNIDDCAKWNWPCLNGGTCLDRIVAYYCRCTPQWIGVHCEHYNECWNITCFNGGVCLDDWEFGTCKCPGGWAGDYCETKDVSCKKYGCDNGGSCQEVINGGWTCRCPDGYHGPRCQYVNYCWGKSDVCEHGGTCLADQNTFACNCPLPWTGPTCAINRNWIYTGIIPTTQEPDGPLDTVTSIIITVAVVVAVAIIIVVIFFMVKHYYAANAAAATGAASIRSPGAPISSWHPSYSVKHP